MNYQKIIFSYGILTVLLMLKHYEEIEDYEECQLIIEAVKEYHTKKGLDSLTKITSSLIDEFILTFKKFCPIGGFAYEKSELYAEELILKNKK